MSVAFGEGQEGDTGCGRGLVKYCEGRGIKVGSWKEERMEGGASERREDEGGASKIRSEEGEVGGGLHTRG